MFKNIDRYIKVAECIWIIECTERVNKEELPGYKENVIYTVKEPFYAEVLMQTIFDYKKRRY